MNVCGETNSDNITHSCVNSLLYKIKIIVPLSWLFGDKFNTDKLSIKVGRS